MIGLGLHSHFSLMRATSSPRALCRSARQQGYTTLALTDTNNLYGLWPFLAACEEEGLVPIIGAEVRTEPHRLFCLVKDRTGYRNLCHLLTPGTAIRPLICLPLCPAGRKGWCCWQQTRSCCIAATRSAPTPRRP